MASTQSPKWWCKKHSIHAVLHKLKPSSCFANFINKINWTNPVVNKMSTKDNIYFFLYFSICCDYMYCMYVTDLHKNKTNSTFSLTFNEKASWIWFLHNCRRTTENIKYYYWKKKITRHKQVIYAFPNKVLSFDTICIINTRPQQDAHSLSKASLFVCRSISVPYAYQCCAFVGCDSITSSSEENDVKKSTGGNAAVTAFS